MKSPLNLCFCLILSLWIMPAKAFLTPEIERAMGEAQICKSIPQDSTYQECMQQNNHYIEKAIERQSQIKTQGFSKTKKKRTLKKIDAALKANLKRCTNGASQSGNQSLDKRQHSYCIYQNMLEILIHVSNRIELYSKK